MANLVGRQVWEAKVRAIGVTGNLPGALTQKIVDAAQKHPTGHRFELSDGKVPGLLLSVAANGSACYVLQVRTLAGAARRPGLGSAATVPLEEARTEAVRLRAVAKAGGDPVAQK